MLDLKAKLLAAGLVTEKQVEAVRDEERVEAERRRARRQANKARGPGGKGRGKGPRGKGPRNKGGGKGRGRGPQSDADFAGRQREKSVAKLKAAEKAEQYEMVRRWVKQTRLDDPKALPAEDAQRFHFKKFDGTISWFTLEAPILEKLKSGEAGIIAYMSNNGIAHVIVPRDLAEDVAEAHPMWLRHLEGNDAAGKVDPEYKIGGRARKKKPKADGEANAEGDAPKIEAQADAPEADAEPADSSKAGAESDAPKAEAEPADTPATDAPATDAPATEV